MAPSSKSCAKHPALSSVTRCAHCRTGMCDECWTLNVDQSPSCVPCAFERGTRRTRRVSFAFSFAGLGAALLFWLWQRFGGDEDFSTWLYIAPLALLVVVIQAASS